MSKHDPLFCPYCQAEMVLKMLEPKFEPLVQRECQCSFMECPSGCIRTRQYLYVKQTLERARSLVEGYKRVINKAIDTPRPLFSQVVKGNQNES